jgi:hypothetical protein
MPEPISGRRLGELLSQLCAALGKPYGAKGENMLTGYLRGLEDWPEEAIEWAIWRACKTWTAKSFPKPAELVALCRESPHKKLEPEGPREPLVDPSEKCRECGEPWGWHRVASLLLGGAHLVTISTIRHRPDCPRHAGQERGLRIYQHTWIDGLPPRFGLEAGGNAWQVPGVLQLVYPLPPLPPEPKRRKPSERIQRSPAPIAKVLVPAGAGDAWENVQTSAGDPPSTASVP